MTERYLESYPTPDTRERRIWEQTSKDWTGCRDDLDEAEKLEPQKQGEGKEDGQHE